MKNLLSIPTYLQPLPLRLDKKVQDFKGTDIKRMGIKPSEFFSQERNPIEMILYEHSDFSFRAPLVKIGQKFHFQHEVIRTTLKLNRQLEATLPINLREMER